MEINFPSTNGELSISDMIKGFRDAGLTETADSLEASMAAKSSINGSYSSIDELAHVVKEVFNDAALRSHFLMAKLEARARDLDPDVVTDLTVNIIDQ